MGQEYLLLGSPVLFPLNFCFHTDKGDLRLGFTNVDLKKAKLERMKFKANKQLPCFLVGNSCIKEEMQLNVCYRFFEQEHSARHINTA